MSHFGLMLLYGLILSLFFGTLLRQERKEILLFTAKMFHILSGASLAAAWLMFPFPL